MVEIVLGIFIAIPVVILLAGALIRLRARWFPRRRRRLRTNPGRSSEPGSFSDRLHYGLHDSGSSRGSGAGDGGDGGGGGGGGSD